MEILFIWLFDYKNFKEQGFNFSSEFIFNVEKEGKKSYQLNISKNKNFIPNFFEKSNILNVTAIIGQNGSGKSNILDFIKNSFPEGYSSIQAQAIISYRLKGDTDRKILLTPNNSFNVEVNQNETDFEIHNYPFDMPTEADGLYGQDYSTAVEKSACPPGPAMRQRSQSSGRQSSATDSPHWGRAGFALPPSPPQTLPA